MTCRHDAARQVKGVEAQRGTRMDLNGMRSVPFAFGVTLSALGGAVGVGRHPVMRQQITTPGRGVTSSVCIRTEEVIDFPAAPGLAHCDLGER